MSQHIGPNAVKCTTGKATRAHYAGAQGPALRMAAHGLSFIIQCLDCLDILTLSPTDYVGGLGDWDTKGKQMKCIHTGKI